MDQLKVAIGGDNRQLKQTLNESKGLLNKFGQDLAAMQSIAAKSLESSGGGLSMLGLKGAAGVAAAAGVVGAAVIQMANQTAEAAVQAGKMAEQYGLNVETFTRLAYAANVNGVAMEDLGQGMKGLSVRMREAANGSEEARAVFKSLGVQYLDSAGKLRPVEAVLADVADAFKKMPDGADKAALSVKLMEEAGIKLIPVLNQGADAIKRWGEEAAKIGLVVTPEQLEAAKEYERNLKRLEATATGLKREVGNEVVPTMAKLSTILLENRGAGLGWWDSFLASITGADNPAKRVQELTTKLGELKQKQQEMASLGQKPDAGLADNISRVEKALQHFAEQAANAAKSVEREEAEIGTRRADLEQKVANKKADIARLLTYIQTGEGFKVEKAEKERLDRQIADQQRLVDAVRNAWQKTREEAEKAKTDAEKMRADAADIGTQTRAQAEGIRDKGRTPAEIASRKYGDMSSLQQDASYAAAVARSAALDGDLKKYAKFADESEKKLRAALQLAGEVEDATKVEDIGVELQRLKESSAALKEKEAKRLDETATAQAAKLNELEGQLKRITEQSRSIDVKVELSQAKSALVELEEKLAALPAQKTVLVNVVTNGSLPADGGSVPGFASGGYIRGPGSGTSDSILARLSNGEWVMRSAAVAYYGPHLMDAINRLQVPRFASGGFVSSVRMPDLVSPRGNRSSGVPVHLHIANKTLELKADPNFADQLRDVLSREALKWGRR